MINSFNPPGVWEPFGAFSMVVVQGQGQLIHLKGQVSLDKDGHVVGTGDMRTQVRQTLENIKIVLESFGGTMSDIFSLTHYATDIEAFMRAGEVRNQFFAAPYPVTTTVQVARLYHPDLLIEITAVAEVPLERFKRPAGQDSAADSVPQFDPNGTP